MAYLQDKAEKQSPLTRYALLNLKPTLQWLTTLKPLWLSSVDKFYVLRWLLGEDTDTHYHHRLSGRSSRGECYCGNAKGCIHPFTVEQSVCMTCFTQSFRSRLQPYLDLTHPRVWNHFNCPPVTPPLSTELSALHQFQAHLPPECNIKYCSLCMMAEASLEHWFLFCPVVGTALTAFLDTPYTPSLLTLSDSPQLRLKLYRALATLRRTLLAYPDLKPAQPGRKFSSEFPATDFLVQLHIKQSAKLLQEFHNATLSLPTQQLLALRLKDSVTCPALHHHNLRLHHKPLLDTVPMANR